MSFSLGLWISGSFCWLFRFPFCRRSLFLHAPSHTSSLSFLPVCCGHRLRYPFLLRDINTSWFGIHIGSIRLRRMPILVFILPYAPWFLHLYAPILSPHALHLRLLAVLHLLIPSCLMDSNVFAVSCICLRANFVPASQSHFCVTTLSQRR